MTHRSQAPSSDAPPPGPLAAAETAQVLARVAKTIADTGDARHAEIFRAFADLVTAPAARRAPARVHFNDAVYAAMDGPLVDEATLDAAIDALLDTSPSRTVR